ncbi:uncharacterized protein OCT59_004943 [Rhizophagus irregularis]|uniref:uncharacterized protein n=1 Tax=Rhizophagus irregularis TaxID=588596 RepID=UPI0033208E1D|nr:hypothetical protein OCT59_004943 [Rhizophagus irregularis]
MMSQYFCAAFYNDWVEKKNGIFIFKKPNISPQLFEIILRFIYCGKVDIANFKVLTREFYGDSSNGLL